MGIHSHAEGEGVNACDQCTLSDLRVRSVNSPRQRSDTNPRWFDHNQIIRQSVDLSGDNFCNTVRLCFGRKSIQFQQDYSSHGKPLAKNQLAEVSVFSD